MYTSDTLFKALGEGGRCFHGGQGYWTLPKRDWSGKHQPGQWQRVDGDLIMCSHGLHFCRGSDLWRWLAPELYVIEIHPEARREDGGMKSVASKARLIEKVETWTPVTQRLYACDIAERVVRLCEHFMTVAQLRVAESFSLQARAIARDEGKEDAAVPERWENYQADARNFWDGLWMGQAEQWGTVAGTLISRVCEVVYLVGGKFGPIEAINCTISASFDALWAAGVITAKEQWEERLTEMLMTRLNDPSGLPQEEEDA